MIAKYKMLIEESNHIARFNNYMVIEIWYIMWQLDLKNKIYTGV